MACLHRSTTQIIFPFIQEAIDYDTLICNEFLLWLKGSCSVFLICAQIVGIELLLGKIDTNPWVSLSHSRLIPKELLAHS